MSIYIPVAHFQKIANAPSTSRQYFAKKSMCEDIQYVFTWRLNMWLLRLSAGWRSSTYRVTSLMCPVTLPPSQTATRKTTNSRSTGPRQQNTDDQNCSDDSAERSTSADWQTADVDDPQRRCSAGTAELFHEEIDTSARRAWIVLGL